MGRLMGRYGTRELEVDRLLREGIFVDLFRAVRQGVRASVESYSIKRLEPLYGFKREVDLRDAGSSIAAFEEWLELGAEGSEARGRRSGDPGPDQALQPRRLREQPGCCGTGWRASGSRWRPTWAWRPTPRCHGPSPASLRRRTSPRPSNGSPRSPTG